MCKYRQFIHPIHRWHWQAALFSWLSMQLAYYYTFKTVNYRTNTASNFINHIKWLANQSEAKHVFLPSWLTYWTSHWTPVSSNAANTFRQCGLPSLTKSFIWPLVAIPLCWDSWLALIVAIFSLYSKTSSCWDVSLPVNSPHTLMQALLFPLQMAEL